MSVHVCNKWRLPHAVQKIILVFEHSPVTCQNHTQLIFFLGGGDNDWHAHNLSYTNTKIICPFFSGRNSVTKKCSVFRDTGRLWLEKLTTLCELLWHIISCKSAYSLRERDHWGDPDVDERIILIWIFEKWEGVETGWSWLRIGTWRALVNTFGFHEMRGISWLAANQLVSQEGLCSME